VPAFTSGGTFALDTEEKDTDNYWVVGTPGQFTIPAGLGGLFVVTVAAQFGADAAILYGEIALIPDTAPNAYAPMAKDLLAGNAWRGCLTAVTYAAAGENLVFTALFSGPASVSLQSTTWASIARIGSLA